jgi:hypothetical protein
MLKAADKQMCICTITWWQGRDETVAEQCRESGAKDTGPWWWRLRRKTGPRDVQEEQVQERWQFL